MASLACRGRDAVYSIEDFACWLRENKLGELSMSRTYLLRKK
jgi:hypothetical protein